MSKVRLILVNFAVIVALLLGASLVCAIAVDFQSWRHRSAGDADAIADADSPAYSDKSYARQVLYDTQHSAVFDFYPFVEWRRHPYVGNTVNVAENGLRRQQHINPQATRKIAFFGASATWGSGVDDNSTMPAQFEKLDGSFVATNYAEGGYDSRQNLNNFLNLIDAGDLPEWAVFVEGAGDVAALCSTGSSLNGHGQDALMKRIFAQSLYQSETKIVLFDSIQRVIASAKRYLSKVGAVQSAYQCASSKERAAAVARVLLENWKIDRLIGQHYGIKTLMVLQPVAYIGAARTDYLRPDKDEGQQYITVYRELFSQIDDQRLNWVVNLTKVVDGTFPIYVDNFHLNPEGNRLMAEAVLKIIRSSQP